MVTYFNRKDLVSFGSYLMSEKRKNQLIESYKESIRQGVDNPIPVEDALKRISHADIENWMQDSQ